MREEALGELRSIIGARLGLKRLNRTIAWGLGYADETPLSAAASQAEVRQDLGHPIDLRVPVGYYEQVKRVLKFFDTDPLFAYLVRRIWEFGNNRFDWVVPAKDGDADAAAKEQGLWNYWARMINYDTSHILPGIDNINIGMFKALSLAGMAPMHWQWGWVDYDGEKFWLPVKMKIEHPLSVAIVPSRTFGGFSVYLKRSLGTSGDIDMADETKIGVAVDDTRKSNEYRELRPATSFLLRFEYATVDARVNRSGAGQWSIASQGGIDDKNSGYPTVPYICLQEAMQLRRGLAAADLRLIDGIINYILLWLVGNSDQDKAGRFVHAPRPERKDKDGKVIEKSTISYVKDLLENTEKADVLELVLPYWIDVRMVSPDTTALLDHRKYLHATSEILHRFGIFWGEESDNPRSGGSALDVSAFEMQVENYRQAHIARFWEMLALRIMNHPRNAGKFKCDPPNYQWRPMATRVAEWRSELIELARIGRLSAETMWRQMGISPAAEEFRIRDENDRGLTDEANRHTPVSFAQQTVFPGGESEVTEDGGNNKRGRPKKMPGEKKEED